MHAVHFCVCMMWLCRAGACPAECSAAVAADRLITTAMRTKRVGAGLACALKDVLQGG